MAEQDATQVQAPAKPAPGGWTWGTGRRKKAVARVRVKSGAGQFVVNKRQLQDYFKEETDRRTVAAPLAVGGNVGASLDIFVSVGGGGSTGQAGAVALGLARALSILLPELDRPLRDQDMLTRDARMKERKKYGQKGARKRFQFSKR